MEFTHVLLVKMHLFKIQKTW